MWAWPTAPIAKAAANCLPVPLRLPTATLQQTRSHGHIGQAVSDKLPDAPAAITGTFSIDVASHVRNGKEN